MLSRAGLNRLSTQASWILLLAGNAPDIDAISALGGSLTYLKYHRHITHSLAAIPLLALLPLLIVRVAGRSPLDWKRAYPLALVGIASHLTLDLTNVYGVRLLLPFSGQWFRWDITSLIDVWIWAALLLGLLAPVLARLVAAEIGAPAKGRGAGRGFAIFALCFLVLYEGGRAVLHQRALAVLDSRLYNGQPPLRDAAFPGPVNPLAWRGLVETREFLALAPVDLAGDFDPTAARVFYKPDPSAALESARLTPAFQEFLRFAQYPLWRVVPASEPENGARVEVMDLRFGDPLQPSFVATALVDARLQVVRSWFQFGQPPH